jgi:hypothetical protein
VTVTALWHTNPVQGLWHTQTPFLGPSRFYARGARRPQRLGKQCGALCTIGSDRESSRALSVNSCECCFLGTECCAFLHHFFNFLLPPTPSSARVLASSRLARAREYFESRFAIDAGRRARQESFRVPGSKARDVGPLPRFLASRFCGIGRRSSPRAAHPTYWLFVPHTRNERRICGHASVHAFTCPRVMRQRAYKAELVRSRLAGVLVVAVRGCAPTTVGDRRCNGSTNTLMQEVSFRALWVGGKYRDSPAGLRTRRELR